MSIIRTVIMPLTLMLLSPGQARADDFAKGMDAYVAGKHKTAFKLLKPAAEAGDQRAYYRVAVMYDLGQGVRAHKLAALAWYRIAADHDPRAQVAMAERLMEGRTIVRDQKAAIDWYRKAASQGNLTALLRLGRAYRDGDGVQKDVVLAHVFASIHVRRWGKKDLAERDKISKELASVLTGEQRAESEELQFNGMDALKDLPLSSKTGSK